MEQYEIDDIKSNLQSYLESHNINTSRLFRCLNPHHSDSNASMKYFNDNKVYCFGCGATYNLIDCIAIMENLDNKQAFKKAIEYYSVGISKGKTYKKEQPNAKPEKCDKNYEKAFEVWHRNLNHSSEAKKYLKQRGISDEVVKKFKLGFNEFDFGQFKFKSIVIPINENSFTARNLTPNEDLRYYKPRGCKIDMFNLKALSNDVPYCVITEGEFDCMSFETIGVNAMALSSANNISKLIHTDKSIDKTYIIAMDNDNAGNIATEALVEHFKEIKANYLIFNNCGFKDANLALTNDKRTFEKEINLLLDEVYKKNDKYRKRKKYQNAEM